MALLWGTIKFCLPRLDQLKQQLHCQFLRLHRAHLLALPSPASGNGEDLPGYPVGSERDGSNLLFVKNTKIRFGWLYAQLSGNFYQEIL